MDIIEAPELKEKLDRGEDIKLVMTLGDLAFQGKHIPGSLNIHKPEDLLKQLQPSDRIIVYCSDSLCPASLMAYHFLIDQGFENVSRFSGGLSAWEQAGYPLEGELVE
jgi:rhodanese-related sulfurtransferase